MSSAQLSEASAVEQWIGGELRQRYNAALREPVPEDWLKLIDENRVD